MKNLTTLALCSAAILLVPVLTGCNKLKGDADSIDSQVEYLPAKAEKGEDWGFIDRDGKMVLADEFKNEPSAVVNGLFSVKNDDGTYALYKFDDKKPAALNDCDALISVGAYVDGLIPLTRKNKRIELADDKGETRYVLNPVNDKEIVYADDHFSNGMLRIQTEDGKRGFVDIKGRVALAPVYDYSTIFVQGRAAVGKLTGDEGDESMAYSVIDKKGETIFRLKKGQEPIGAPYCKILFARDNDADRVYFYNADGEATKCPAKVQGVRDYNDRVYVFVNADGDRGILDYEGNEIARAKYSRIGILADGGYIASKDDKAVILNKKGDEVAQINDYSLVASVYNDFPLVAIDNSGMVLYDAEGQPIKNGDLYSIGTDISICDGVNTDYFNLEGMVGKIANDFTAKGFSKYDIGAGPMAYFADPSDYTYTNQITMPDLEMSGFRYDVSGTLIFSEQVSNYQYDPDTYDGSYVWNPASTLTGFQLAAKARVDLGKPAVDAMVKALEVRGFKVETKPEQLSRQYISILSNGKLVCVVNCDTENSADQLDVLAMYDADGDILPMLTQTLREQME